jgi:hypothetical protein
MGVRSLWKWLLVSACVVISCLIVSGLLAQDKNQTATTGSGLDELKLAFSKFKESIVGIRENISTVSMTAPPVGGVVAYAGAIDQDHALRGSWMVCDGRPLSKTDYPELFAAIGTNYGAGTDSSGAKVAQRDFNLPNYQGYFLRGVDPTKSIDKGPRSLGGGIGSREDFATALPKEPFRTATDGAHQHALDLEIRAGRQDGRVGNTVANPYQPGGPHKTTANDGAHQHTVTLGGDAETRPVNMNVNWIIRVK